MPGSDDVPPEPARPPRPLGAQWRSAQDKLRDRIRKFETATRFVTEARFRLIHFKKVRAQLAAEVTDLRNEPERLRAEMEAVGDERLTGVLRFAAHPEPDVGQEGREAGSDASMGASVRPTGFRSQGLAAGSVGSGKGAGTGLQKNPDASRVGSGSRGRRTGLEAIGGRAGFNGHATCRPAANASRTGGEFSWRAPAYDTRPVAARGHRGPGKWGNRQLAIAIPALSHRSPVEAARRLSSLSVPGRRSGVRQRKGEGRGLCGCEQARGPPRCVADGSRSAFLGRAGCRARECQGQGLCCSEQTQSSSSCFMNVVLGRALGAHTRLKG